MESRLEISIAVTKPTLNRMISLCFRDTLASDSLKS